MSVFLVTGATGVVGSAIVPALLRTTKAEILILLRPKKGQPLATRLAEIKKFWVQHYGDLTSDLLDRRVHPVAGEITEPALVSVRATARISLRSARISFIARRVCG
jgi:thioester reductase-like protein